MGGHTPTPWRIEEGTTCIWGACNPDDQSTYGMGYPVTDARITPVSMSSWCKGPNADEGEANARRIVASVNATAGIPLEALEAGVIGELVEAVREAREALHFHYVEWDGEPEDAVPLQLARSKCDAILAKVKGEGK